MGGNFLAHTAAWTLLYLVQVLSADRSLFQDLGLSALPDVTKINISLDEYTRMMGAYLEGRRYTVEDPDTIPKLTTYRMSRRDWWQDKEDGSKLKFPVRRTHRAVELDNAQLRFLVAPFPGASTTVRVQVHQILKSQRKHFLDEKVFYLSHNLTKWCDLDVSSAVQSWLNGDRNLGLELTCVDCISNVHPIEAAISALIYPQHRRYRRSSSPYQPLRRTDCRESRKGNSKRRCCRHNMMVKFEDLRFPEMRYIVQPKSFEAGFCQGQCPPNYNFATNHSRIQSLIHQMDRKNAKLSNRRAVPKACCAPSKLEPLEILRINPADESKLKLEKWDNMQVVECACS